jgi:hypothetical protein
MFQELGASFVGEGDVFWMLVIVQLWELPWKGAALWRAARNKHLGWFVALMLVHLAGLIDIIYLFYFSEPKKRIAPRTQKTTRNVK